MLAFATVVTLIIASCGTSNSEATATTDSTAVDSAAVVVVDTVKVDSVVTVADTVKK